MNTQEKKGPSKREWLDAWLDGMEKSGFTGEAMPRIHFNQGHITRLVPMREDA